MYSQVISVVGSVRWSMPCELRRDGYGHRRKLRHLSSQVPPQIDVNRCFFYPRGVAGWLVAQILEGPFSAVLKPILHLVTQGSFCGIFQIYKIDTFLNRSKRKRCSVSHLLTRFPFSFVFVVGFTVPDFFPTLFSKWIPIFAPFLKCSVLFSDFCRNSLQFDHDLFL